LKLIEQYLERVRVYLPLDSEDTIVELQTHLIEEAERIGGGAMTAGSAMMAIERMGDPKRVANEYAGSGRKVGPVPAEYVTPVSRIAVVLVALGLALTVGAYMIGITLTEIFGTSILNLPLGIPIIIGVNLVIAFIIIGVILMFDRDKPSTEKTILEGIFGVGVESLKPKAKWEAAGDFIMGIIWGIILMLPAMVITYTESFQAIYMTIVIFLFLGAIRGALFFIGGENNLNLTVEVILSVLWIAIAAVIVATNVGFPLEYVYVYDGSSWQLFNIVQFFVDNEIPFVPFDWIWAVIIFITVAAAVWRVFVSVMKISVYIREGKGLWWKGSWGERRRLTKPFWKRIFRDEEETSQGGGVIYQDGYSDSEESQ
jgi:hypothetical protein